MTLALTYLDPHETGAWPGELPERTTIGGRVYVRSRVALPRAGVIAHYREAVPTLARHLEVLRDGTWRVTHIDDFNPHASAGHAVLHVIADTSVGGVLLGGALLWLATRVGR